MQTPITISYPAPKYYKILQPYHSPFERKVSPRGDAKVAVSPITVPHSSLYISMDKIKNHQRHIIKNSKLKYPSSHY